MDDAQGADDVLDVVKLFVYVHVLSAFSFLLAARPAAPAAVLSAARVS
jgi:hypothetical protein